MKPLSILLSLALAGCGLIKVGPDYARPTLPIAGEWQAPQAALPHGGTIPKLVDWWRQFDDPLLAELIETAQKESATLTRAWARMATARWEAVAAGADRLPAMNLQATSQRSTMAMGSTLMHQRSREIGVLASWELDLFGGLARQQENALAALEASQARWHEARVSLAADTALSYLEFRYLERQLAQGENDAASRGESARLSEALGSAGFQSSSEVALALGSAAESLSTLTEMRARRDMALKSLVALTGLAEPDLKTRLQQRSGRFPKPAAFAVAEVPAAALSQRPDLAAAERDLAAASAGIGHVMSLGLPRLSLTGNLTATRLSNDGIPLSARTWGFGPTLTLPISEGRRLAAGVESARAQYTAAESVYRQKAREAVKEVEQALVRLEAARERRENVSRTAAGYRAAFLASESRQKAGLSGLLDLEASRRMMLSADLAVAAWEQEQVAAWIALYRAVGGGWSPENATH